MINSVVKKLKYDLKANRIGPDIPFTHWNLYLKRRMMKLCEKQFYHFGLNSEFRPGAYAIDCASISIGNNVTIRPTTMLFGDSSKNSLSILIEDNVLLGAGVHIYVNNHIYRQEGDCISNVSHSDPKLVVLKKGCWIGANAVILPGVEIGEYSIVGAGSIVTKSVPDFVVVAGNPAKIIKQVKLEE